MPRKPNPETIHVATVLQHLPDVDIPALIEQARTEAGCDSSIRAQLPFVLADTLYDLYTDFIGEGVPDIGYFRADDMDNDQLQTWHLFVPLLNSVIDRVNFTAVAEIILAKHANPTRLAVA